MDRAYKRACEAIDKKEPICYEVAKELEVVFDKVKDVRWFILEVAEHLG